MAEKTVLNNSIILLILVVSFAAGYLYYSQSVVPNQMPIESPPIPPRDDLAAFKDASINFSILENERLKSFKVFGESPVKPGATGKRDLFAPF